MIEQFQKSGIIKGFFAAMLPDLPKLFDWISHELLVVKLNTYIFDMISLNFILVTFNKQKQQEIQGLQAFAFFVITVNDEHTKPRLKENPRG